MWARQRHALLKAGPRAAEAASAARAAAEAGPLPELSEQPVFVTGGRLYPHQLAAVNWLRSMWVRKQAAVLADDQGLGKTATLITYLQCML